MKYRKTALVEAEQFLPPHSIPAGCFQKGTAGDIVHGHGEWMLKTLEGEHALRRGDYICTGPAGEKWNVELSIFEATYEPADAIAHAAPAPSDEADLAGDVVRLVIAAREVAFGGMFDSADPDKRAAIRELDQASEAFASRVPWEDEPEDEA